MKKMFKNKELIVTGVLIIVFGLVFQNIKEVAAFIAGICTKISTIDELSGRGMNKLGEVFLSLGMASVMLNFSLCDKYNDLLKKRCIKRLSFVLAIVIPLIWICWNDILTSNDFWITTLGSLIVSMALMNFFNVLLASTNIKLESEIKESNEEVSEQPDTSSTPPNDTN